MHKNRKSTRRAITTAAAGLMLGVTALVAAPSAQAYRPGGDGTTGCHRYVQVWYGGPWVCLY